MEKTIKLFYSTKDKEEQDLKCLSLSQLQTLAKEQSCVDMINFESEKEYLNAKTTLASKYDFTNTKQILLVMEHTKNTFKKRLEVNYV